jgi:hypothetical protein
VQNRKLSRPPGWRSLGRGFEPRPPHQPHNIEPVDGCPGVVLRVGALSVWNCSPAAAAGGGGPASTVGAPAAPPSRALLVIPRRLDSSPCAIG